jgi:hypothetical protein
MIRGKGIFSFNPWLVCAAIVVLAAWLAHSLLLKPVWVYTLPNPPTCETNGACLADRAEQERRLREKAERLHLDW